MAKNLLPSQKIEIMEETKNVILGYLREQLRINTEALKIYDTTIVDTEDLEIKKMREVEAIKLRDRVYELTRHIAVIELIK